MLKGAHLHLLVNHAPIYGSLFALALLVASFFFAADVLRRTALVVLIFTALAGAAAKFSGDAAEDAIRGFPGVTRQAIHTHEESGDVAFIAAGIVGVLALGALIRWRRAPIPRGATVVGLIATAFAAGSMVYTGFLGGRVRHTEVRPGAKASDAMIVEPPRQRRPPPP